MLLSSNDMVDDAAACVAYCEGQLQQGADPASSIIILGQSMGGGVAVELASTRYPRLPNVNCRSFSSLSAAASSTLGIAGSSVARGVVRLALSLAFSRLPWRSPLDSARHWRQLHTGPKLLIYHPQDQVIGHAAALHTALHDQSALDGIDVIQLGGSPRDAHNEHPADFAPREWSAAISWMQRALQLQ